MGSKFKPRQQYQARSFIALDAIFNHKGGYMRHRTERRAKERDDVRKHLREWEGSDEPVNLRDEGLTRWDEYDY